MHTRIHRIVLQLTCTYPGEHLSFYMSLTETRRIDEGRFNKAKKAESTKNPSPKALILNPKP